MMNTKLLLMFLLLTGVPFLAFAGDDMEPDKSDGCGLGWQVMDNKSIVATIVRGTTNVSVPPTFGMSTGTIDCEQHSLVKNEKKSIYYTESNFENLLAEMSEGKGEYLNGFANVLGCKDQKAFSQMSQRNYGKIVPQSDVTPSQLLQNVKNQIASTRMNCAV